MSEMIICCFFLLLSYATCGNTFTVWSDDLDTMPNWLVKGSVNSIHSNYCPTSNDCLQIQTGSSITTSVSTENYLNFTLVFGITIIDELSSQSTILNNTLQNNDYCRIYYKINKLDTNWKFLASYIYDKTNDFNNKLPMQSYVLPSSINSEYYDSIDLQFINAANSSNTNMLCYIDQISLTADYHNAPSHPFKLDTLYLVIGAIATILCALFVCLLWLYFRLAKEDKYNSQLRNIESIKLDSDRVLSISEIGKTPISTGRLTINTPISADLVGSYQPQEQSDTTNNLHTKNSKSLSKIDQQNANDIRSDHDEMYANSNGINAAENNKNKSNKSTENINAINKTRSTTQVKLDNIMNQVLNDENTTTNNTNIALPTDTNPTKSASPSPDAINGVKNIHSVISGRRDTELSTQTITAFQPDRDIRDINMNNTSINPIQLTSYDLYEEKAVTRTPSPMNEINDELDFKCVDGSIINANSITNSFQSSILPLPSNVSTTFNTITTYNTNTQRSTTLKEQNEHNSLSYNESFVSGLKNRYPVKSSIHNDVNNSNITPIHMATQVSEMSLINIPTIPTDNNTVTNNMNNDHISFVAYFDRANESNQMNNVSSKKIRFKNQYTQNEEEESLDIGSMTTNHTLVYENNYTVSAIPESQNHSRSRMSQSNTEVTFNLIDESQKL